MQFIIQCTMYRTKSAICFLAILAGVVKAAVPVPNSKLQSKILENQSSAARKSLETGALEMPHVMKLDIEEDSISEEQLFQRVLARINSQEHHELQSKTRIPTEQRSSRTRKSIFGKDNRISVGTSVEAQIYPYSTVVTLSSGCTGTLIGVKHVLTAAHCVHDGRKFLSEARHLKIGMLQRTGSFHWIKVRKIHLPKGWKTTAGKQRIKYDYALLRLKRRHSRPTMAIKSSTLKRGSPMQFAGFHGDKWYNTMWYSKCRVAVVIRGAILSFCDGAKGISGSGVFVRSGAGINNAVVGVVSAIGKGRLRGKRHVFNVVISLTSQKIKKILKWMKRSKKSRKRIHS